MDPLAILSDVPPAAYTIRNLCYRPNMMWWECDRANTTFLSLHMDLTILDISYEKNPPNVNFCVWLLSFSMTLSMFVQVVPYISCCGWGHCMHILITPFWVAFTLCLLWEAWQATVCGVVKSQTWLSYWGGMHTVMKKTAVNIFTKFSM